jgi:hypothetical protein
MPNRWGWIPLGFLPRWWLAALRELFPGNGAVLAVVVEGAKGEQGAAVTGTWEW